MISAGRARTVRLGVYYHLMPAISHDSSPEEMRAAATEAARRQAMPSFNDGVNSGVVLGIHIADGDFAFASQPNSFVFPANRRATIEDAIKYNLSNYNTCFFSSIDEIGSFLDKYEIAPQLPGVLPGQLRWEYVKRNDDANTAAIWPENSGDVLFRGQVKRYLPCVSTAARGLGIEARLLHELSEAHQARLIANFIRAEWFTTLLRETSAVKWLQENHIFLDNMAVAQHYGLPTGYIDLTQSFEVASFFACCRYDPAQKRWTPASEGEGVVYVLFWRAVSSAYEIQPINLQFFPRPSEQWGWTCELLLGDDFDKLPFVGKFVFKHDVQASQRILTKFAHGASLFPADPLSDLADKIVGSPILPIGVAKRIAKDVIDDPQGKPGATVEEVLSLLQNFEGVKLSSDVSIPDLARIQGEMDRSWQQRKAAFLKVLVSAWCAREKIEVPAYARLGHADASVEYLDKTRPWNRRDEPTRGHRRSKPALHKERCRVCGVAAALKHHFFHLDGLESSRLASAHVPEAPINEGITFPRLKQSQEIELPLSANGLRTGFPACR